MINPEQLLNAEIRVDGDLWIAPLPRVDHRLVYWRRKPTERIFQIEVFESRDTLVHARMYLPPIETHVPTLVVGHPSIVGIYAWRDHQALYPLHVNGAVHVQDCSFSWPGDFESIPAIASVLKGKVSYYVRPSSYLLCDIDFTRLLDEPVKVKRFANFFDHTIFAHITGPNEWEEAFPSLGIYGLLVTNSSLYVAAHLEYEFAPVTTICENGSMV